MSSVAGPRLSPPTHAYRHHPYAAPQAQSSSRPKWASTEREKLSPRDVMPPSPPRSRRDQSETPSVGLPLGMAFGANGGGKWWDEELPAPPSSLSSILESFRKSGEGDRDLLLAILGAKKAEEERLTALIQTRLTILQARLSLHSAAASVAASTPSSYPIGLEPRGSSSSASASAPSPKLMTPIEEHPSAADSLPPPATATTTATATAKKQGGGFWVHPSDRERERESTDRAREHRLPPIRTGAEHPHSHSRKSGSTSPRSDDARRSANGLDMLLDAGMGRSSI